MAAAEEGCGVIRTQVTEHYGIDLPFVSAGMGFIAMPPLPAAVSNARGFGQLARGGAPSRSLWIHDRHG